MYQLTKDLKKNPLIGRVDSIVTTDSKITKDQYYRLYHLNDKEMDKQVKQLLATTTRPHLTVITIVPKAPINTPQMDDLIQQLRMIKPPTGMTLQLTGVPVSNYDLLATIARIIPHAILWIIVFTYLILLVLLRSLFLPFKAILMNILSLCACYGALVLVFQDGYLHEYLNFEPQGLLDISLLVIIFCCLIWFFYGL